jgi:hypothetical protein
MPNTRNTARDTLRAALCFAAQMKLLLIEVPIVWFFMWRLKTGALPAQHGWLTGKLPGFLEQSSRRQHLRSRYQWGHPQSSPHQRDLAPLNSRNFVVCCHTD